MPGLGAQHIVRVHRVFLRGWERASREAAGRDYPSKGWGELAAGACE